ncbi:hypothetical protein RBG61_00675 [Paludicola sp. MB14-C6]|uniref:hypothetical protein n=1 Tax=Paludihabitans sp. MB14-C6 TaxID=3070656 RepID=UPI0027DE53A9|nr:hypothetical protein [Paludicola sp. MB14-C6]WMJ23202.1 hypothetical protein RBG61_00675 [Paludicola sp. MB14-C6]
MGSNENTLICKSIFEYISKKLYDWMDHAIFTKTSIEELGELYYNHVLSVVQNASAELLNAVIKTVKPKNVECNSTKDYYIALCSILHIKKLPSEVLTEVEREYEEIFVQKYNTVLHKYQSEITRINTKLNEVKIDSDAIKNAKPSHSFMRDISTDEQKLYELCSKCNLLKTRKEMLKFAIDYLNSKLSEFCDINNVQSVENAKKQETLKLSKVETYEAKFAFSSYRDYVEIVEDDVNRSYALFFKVKIYAILENALKQYHYSSYTKLDDEAINEYKNYLSLIPKIDDLYLYKSSKPSIYCETLEKFITDYEVIDELTNNLESSVCLRERNGILIKAINLYKQGEFELFNNIIPIQIEGMFADYLRDTTTFCRFSKMDIYINAVLKDKIRHLQEVNGNIYPESVEYFMYYFNNMIRNKIAHGRYSGNSEERIQDEIFAKELILDMGMLVYMLTRKSETEKMYRFIHGYQKHYRQVIRSSEHPCFGALFNDIIGQKHIVDYDTMEKYRPIQVAYWLVNPYYERIYAQVEDKNDLLELRDEFLSKDFWEYVLQKLEDVIIQKYDYLNINMECISVVNGLFKCNVSSDVKQILGKVNSALKKIRDIQIADYENQ